MNIVQIEEVVKNIVTNTESGDLPQPDFIYELLLAYGHRKQSVTRLKTGERNLARDEAGTVFWKRHLYFKVNNSAELHGVIDAMRKEARTSRHKIRFVIATDFNLFLAVDTKTGDTLDIEFKDLAKKFDFFLPWAGMEKAVYQGENPADVKAAEKLAKLFDEIKADNFDSTSAKDPAKLHELNVFLSRLLFCFFAEDTNIFADNQFSDAIASHTNDDGSDLADYLKRLFNVLNQAEADRPGLPDYLANFPYVNGGLFKDDIQVPTFSRKSRKILIECGAELDWSDINPDIFGSMFQAVVHTEQRSNMGQHYTSVPNIMKVIEPLFLNDLYEELDKHQDSEKKLLGLQERIGKIKIFDPACGSGNFLIIAYKELRKLEMEILKRLQELEFEKSGQMFKPFSVIQLSQFYGIEIDDFAHEVAILSLWLTEHQMNVAFKDEFGESLPSLPLKNGGNIFEGNATRKNWEEVCPKNVSSEVYLLGNPPYKGYAKQTKEHQADKDYVFSEESDYKKLDYIGCWFYLAARYIQGTSSKYAFVTTNSLTQGEQVALMWPKIFSINCEIGFANTSFKWRNNAKDEAGVTVVIIGIRNKSKNTKQLYSELGCLNAENINGYLANSKSNVIVSGVRKPISDFPTMIIGSKATDNGVLILSEDEKTEIVELYPKTEKFIKRYVGADDFLNGYIRYCLLVTDKDADEAFSIPPLAERFEACRDFRLESKKLATRNKAQKSYAFDEQKYQPLPSIVIPQTTSENRDYIPIGFLNDSYVISNGLRLIYDAEPWIFSILSSRMHNVWLQAVAGRLETRIQYSNTICFNTFPIKSLSSSDKEKMVLSAFKIIEARESFADKSLVDLYDPEKMPESLHVAHEENDKLVESFYRKKPFESDEERLEHLFNLYEKMVEEEKNA